MIVAQHFEIELKNGWSKHGVISSRKDPPYGSVYRVLGIFLSDVGCDSNTELEIMAGNRIEVFKIPLFIASKYFSNFGDYAFEIDPGCDLFINFERDVKLPTNKFEMTIPCKIMPAPVRHGRLY